MVINDEANQNDYDYRELTTHVKTTGAWVFACVGAYVICVAALNYFYAYNVPRIAAVYVFLLTGELLGLRQMLGLRMDLATLTKAARSHAAESGNDVEDDSEGVAREAAVRGAESEIENFGGGHLNYLLSAIGFLAVLTVIYGLIKPTVGTDAGETAAFVCGVVFFIGSFASIVLGRYYKAVSTRELPEASGLACWFFGSFWLLLMTSAMLFMRFATSRPGADSFIRAIRYQIWEGWLTTTLAAFVLIVAIEVFFRGISGVFSKRKGAAAGVVPTNLLTLRILFLESNPIAGFFTAMENAFGINLKSTWALDFVKKAITPICCALLIITWLTSGLVMVNVTEEGILERFGRPVTRHALGPGLHLTYPWPIDRVRRVEVTRLRVKAIGYEDAREGASLLWTKSHAGTEYALLLGNGRDLIAVNAEMHYRINDVFDYFYGSQNPEAELEVIAYRVLMTETVGKTLDDVLAQNVGQLFARVKKSIQEQADAHELGIEVIAFAMKGLHPPVAVAPDYQAVVSAQVDKKTRGIRANAYRMESIPMAEAEARWTTNNALAGKATRLAEANGEAAIFITLEETYKASPALFRARLRQEGLEGALKMKKVYIIDDRIEADGGSLWIDQRPLGRPADY